MNRIPAYSIILVLLAYAVCWPTIINIPADYPTIQQGIDASADGDTVLVQPGTYYENINFNGHNIVLGSLFLTTGDTSYISQTVIDAQGHLIVVTFNSSENETTAIIGFLVIGGFSYSGPGAGIACLNASNPVIKNNIIGNNTTGFGGVGGGIYCESSNPKVIGNIIAYNSGDIYGGGIYLSSSNALIQNNLIFRNITTLKAGGIGMANGNPVLYNNIITENIALDGTGIWFYNTNASIRNSIIWNDSSYSDGSEIEIYGDAPSIEFCNIQDTLWPGAGNISINPLFRDPDNGDFHLMSIACGDSADSPCIDAGDPNILDSLLNCSWGLGDLRSDMGAYGGGDSLITGIGDAPSPLPKKFLLLQNYPNPFNATTTVKYALADAGPVRIDIYDLLGRLVETLVDEEKQAGQHQAVWDASGYSSGIYFYRLEAGNFTQTRKMILLK
ncbi:MAG: T9SS type A sorting domain-containing protein [Candidatus Zixiibacteriota bacterium]|nr:MAG: T9SS type A sorting domain-containing protein [candidate division Zixibacteria bacterium]